MNIRAVIMAGGSGARLWPLSRAAYPKQFLTLCGEKTMLQSTIDRISELGIQSITIICNEEHRFIVAEQLKEVSCRSSIILEPIMRNTAPAVALAALEVKDDPILLVLAADQVIEDQAAFNLAVSNAIPFAKSGKLVLFGIEPIEPHVGYGYIKRGGQIGEGFKVDDFIEKPVLDEAENYVSSGEYYWNSEMFMFRASRYLEELEKFEPDVYKACKASMEDSKTDMDFLRVDVENFKLSPSVSVDFAIMEKVTDKVVVPMDAKWSDIESWSSLWAVSEKDADGNVSNGDVMLHDAKNSYIKTDEKLVAAIGVDDLIIVSTKDVVMVAHKDSVQEVKEIAKRLKEESRNEWRLHREVYRPWGKYDSIDNGKRYQAKRITVKPGEKLSTQMHHHRAEHWVVVLGTAKVTNGEKIFLLSENESTYIPSGVVHSLENVGKIDLEVIEVQTGGYLCEDDIVRFEDAYGRS